MEEKIIELIATHLERGDYKITVAIIFTSVIVAIIWKFKSFLGIGLIGRISVEAF